MFKKITTKPAFLVIMVLLVISQLAFTQSSQTSTQPAVQTLETGSVELNSFYVYNWSWINSPYSCRDPNTGCWVYLNYKAPGWAVSQQSVTIDPKWKNPTLVFWTKYYTARIVNFAYVEVQVDGSRQWDRLKVFTGSKNWWHQETINLSAYSGKKIIVKFYAEPNIYSPYRDQRSTARNYTKELFYAQGVAVLPEPPEE